MKNIKWKSLITSLSISLGVGVVSSIVTRGSMEQYKQMYRPPFSPPGWLFPVVWTILFILMGIAAYLVYEENANTEDKKSALFVYVLQLLANFTWSVIFFNFDAYLVAFAWILLLWYLIFITLKQFYEINKIAGILFAPYLLWVTFAIYLNFAIALYYFF